MVGIKLLSRREVGETPDSRRHEPTTDDNGRAADEAERQRKIAADSALRPSQGSSAGSNPVGATRLRPGHAMSGLVSCFDRALRRKPNSTLPPEGSGVTQCGRDAWLSKSLTCIFAGMVGAMGSSRGADGRYSGLPACPWCAGLGGVCRPSLRARWRQSA